MTPELEGALRLFFERHFYYIGGAASIHFKNNDQARDTVEDIRRMLGVVPGSPQQRLPL